MIRCIRTGWPPESLIPTMPGCSARRAIESSGKLEGGDSGNGVEEHRYRRLVGDVAVEGFDVAHPVAGQRGRGDHQGRIGFGIGRLFDHGHGLALGLGRDPAR